MKIAWKHQVDRFLWMPEMPTKLSPDPQTVSYSSRNMREMSKSTVFDECQKCPRNCPWTPKQCAINDKNCEKGPNRRVLMTTWNAPEIVAGPQKQCVIAHENYEKGPNLRVWWLPKISMKLSLDPKQCAIAHEKYDKGRNRWVLMNARNAHEIVPGPPNSVL